MKKATQYHLSRLVRAHGTYSHVARAVGVTPRWIRLVRNGGSPNSNNRTLLMAGKLLLLRELLRELRSSGALTSTHLAAAWSCIYAKQSCLPVQTSCVQGLPPSRATLPPQW